MTDTAEHARPVPRWLHAWAVLAASATLLLLALGQMVTSFRAGMADPVWPTEPWYLFSNYKLDFGYLIEHTHRIVAFTVGGLVIVLAFGLWWTEPRKVARWAGALGLVVLIAGFGEFHRGLMAQRGVPTAEVRLPLAATGTTVAGFVAVLTVAASGLFAGLRGAGLRLLGVAGLLAVMIQGLLGGFRVKLNELVGTDLAAVHGVFAQVVFGLLVALAVLTGRPAAADIPQPRARSFARWSAALAALLFVQVVWGALVRHDPTPLTQRLHFLTAFLATAVAVWVLRNVFADSAARARVGWWSRALVALIAAQLVLGVEAWMAKFGAYTLPELVPITPENAAIRTAHALVGSGVLAAAVALAVRLRWTRTGNAQTPESADSDWSESRRSQPRAAEVVSRFRGDVR